MPLDAQPHTRLDATQPDANPFGCGRYWAVCQTHPQAERWATANIQRAGYVAYLPLMTVRRRDRALRTLTHIVEAPLFAGYTFAQLNNTDPWTPLRYAHGVAKLFMNELQPYRLASGIISALQATEAVRRNPAAQRPSWAPGTPCALARGYAMEGLPAVVLSTQHNQASIAVMFLGALRQISVPLDALTVRE